MATLVFSPWFSSSSRPFAESIYNRQKSDMIFFAICIYFGVTVSRIIITAFFNQAGKGRSMPFPKMIHTFLPLGKLNLPSESIIVNGVFHD